MDEPNKMVRFDLYCYKCKHYDEKDEHKEPCDECLSEPLNLNTVRPVNFKERK